jgi:hypothetical protein
MSKSNTWENDLLLLVFNNTNASLIGDATGLRGSTTAGSLYLSLHTADPGEAGNQSTNEIAYTSYARGQSGLRHWHWRIGYSDALWYRHRRFGHRQAAVQGRD